MTHIVSTKRLSSGKYIDLAKLTVNDVDLNDIDRSLNYIYRFTGHWKDSEPLTVAQHLKLVVHISKMLFPDDLETELDCTIHDFPEAYTGDIATPLKKLFGPQFKDYESEIEDVVYNKFFTPVVGHALTKEIYEQRKICDLLALDCERRSIWRDQRSKEQWPTIPMEGILTVKEKQKLYNWAKEERYVDLSKMYRDIATRVKRDIEINEVNI